MIKTPFESRDQVLYSTLPTLSTIPTLSSATLHQVKNGQTLKWFWSSLYVNSSTEFINDVLKTWCAKHEIEIQTTASYSPSQNEVAEQMNRMIIKLACTMINMQNLPKFL